MKAQTCIVIAGVLGAALLGALPSQAQEKRISPHETVSAVIHGDRVTVVYGGGYTKDPQKGAPRKIWGGLVPYGQVWRTGADEATLLITQSPIAFGAATIPAGAYTLWLLPKQDGSATLIVNKQIGQWGIGPGSYDAKADVAAVELKAETLSQPVDQFTIGVADAGAGGVLKLAWEKTQFSAPFTVKR
jgi:hypothetical protein